MSTRSKTPSRRVIRASEIGEYVYCHRAWWLGRVMGVENANRAELEAGIARHQAHGQGVRRGLALERVTLLLLLLALLVGIALVIIYVGI